MKTRTLLKVEGKYPDILTMESRVKGLHYLYEASPSQIVVAPSRKALAYIGQEPVLKLTANKVGDALAYWKGYSDALDDVRRAYTQAEGKGGSHAQANP